MIGWLLGIATAIAALDVISERRTVLEHDAAPLIRDGWRIVRADMGGLFVTLERPRLRLPRRHPLTQ